MMDKTYLDKVVRLCEYADHRGILEGFHFEGCEIKGPAVVVMQGCALTDSGINGDPEGLFWEVQPPRERVIGAILLKDCTLERCNFTNVGFAGPPEFIKQMRGGVGLT